MADVLLLFASGPASIGVSEISRQLGLSKAVVHRILRSLASREMVASVPASRGYRLGPAAAALGARALGDLDLRSVARPVLRRLREATAETTTLSGLVGASRVYLDQFEGPQEIKMTVELGRPYPLHAGASSKAILAFRPAVERAQILAGPLPRLTAQTVVDPARLEAELSSIVATGVATSLGERQYGAGSVAAPVFALDDEPLGAISACGPVERFDPAAVARLAVLVRAAALEISGQLGWRPVRVRRAERPA